MKMKAAIAVTILIAITLFSILANLNTGFAFGLHMLINGSYSFSLSYVVGIIAALGIVIYIITIPFVQNALKGKEKPGIVFISLGVLLYIASFAIGFLTALLFTSEGIIALVGTLGLVFVFIYPVLFCFMLIRCALNTGKKWVIFIYSALTILFVAFHMWCIQLVLPVSVGYLQMEALSGIEAPTYF